MARLFGSDGSLAISPDAKKVAIGHDDGSARIWELASGRLLATFRGHLDAVTSVAFSLDGRTLLSGSFDNTARLWDVATGQADAIIGVAFSPDDKFIVVRSRDGTMRQFALDGQELTKFQAPN